VIGQLLQPSDGSDLPNLRTMTSGPVAFDRHGFAVLLHGDQHALEEQAHDRLCPPTSLSTLSIKPKCPWRADGLPLLPAGALHVIMGSFQTLRPLAMQRGSLRFDVLGQAQANLDSRRFQRLHDQPADEFVDRLAGQRLRDLVAVIDGGRGRG
jgi:hypothetical protein